MIKPIAAAATALLAASALAQNQEGTEGAIAPSPARDMAMQRESQVMNLMRLSNHAEIQAAELVLARTEDEAVRRFADRLLRDHQLADAMLDSLAESKGIALTPADFDEGAAPPTGARPAPPRSDDHLRSEEADDLYRQPMGQSPSLAPREDEQWGQEPLDVPGRESADPLEYEADRSPQQGQQATPAGLGLPQINEPPSAQEVRSEQQQSAPGQQGAQPTQPTQSGDSQPPETQAPDVQPPNVQAPGAEQPEDRTRERPLDLRIAHLKAQRMLRTLESADDADLRAVYAAAMIKSHDQTVQNLRTGLQSVADPDVEDLLERFIPILEQHARLARHVQRELGGQAVEVQQEGP